MTDKKYSTLSFNIDAQWGASIEDLIDQLRIELRREGVKFTKKQLFRYLTETALQNFDQEHFVTWMKRSEQAIPQAIN